MPQSEPSVLIRKILLGYKILVVPQSREVASEHTHTHYTNTQGPIHAHGEERE